MKDLPHLLLVDDEEPNRVLTGIRLQEYGFKVSSAASGKEALELLEVNEYHLILLDFRMPEMNGLEVLTQIRLQYTSLQLPVIMVTGNDNDNDIIKSFHFGANDYLLKPLNYQVAAARIHTHVSQSNLSKLKDSFLEFTSHDLKKPLIVINDISTELKASLIENYNIDTETQYLLDLITSTTSNTQKMITGFLDKNNTKESIVCNIQRLNLNDIIKNIVVLNQSFCSKKSITLTKNLTTKVYRLESDLFRVTQILDNLIGNAIKFSPSGSTIEIFSILQDSSLSIEIKDDGPGIAEDEFDLLFKKHAVLTNKPTGNEKSSGIGLALCYELSNQINANIGAKNNPDGGATFYLEFKIDS